jgi:Ni,Fe-hydrogenase III small subunit/Pyruvate/2-oxoacid:ferredoxin oxidoreductase delta subunit
VPTTLFNVLMARWHQGHRTVSWPRAPAVLPDRYRGRPALDATRCPPGCAACLEVCPTGAIQADPLAIDLGRCLFCTECTSRCSSGAIQMTGDHRLAARRREDLLVAERGPVLAESLSRETRRLFGRSLKLRQVSAGGCNACEADTNVLTTVVFDLGRFGIQFVASPRHADGLLVTGPVCRNMELALRKTYDALPSPRIVIAVGACAISGGPYIGHDEVAGGVDALLPVDLYVPGCPPHPLTVLDGLLRLLGRLNDR